MRQRIMQDVPAQDRACSTVRGRVPPTPATARTQYVNVRHHIVKLPASGLLADPVVYDRRHTVRSSGNARQ